MSRIAVAGAIAAVSLLAGCGGSGSETSSTVTTVTETLAATSQSPSSTATTVTVNLPEGQCLTTAPDGDELTTDCDTSATGAASGSSVVVPCSSLVGHQVMYPVRLDHLCDDQVGTYMGGHAGVNACYPNGGPIDGEYYWIDLPHGQILFGKLNDFWHIGDINALNALNC
jgi:hypothetical protein